MSVDPDHLACQQLVEIVTDYMEGAMSSDDRTRFEEHLLICRDCTSYVQQLRATERLAASLGGGAANLDAKEALLAAFRGRKAT